MQLGVHDLRQWTSRPAPHRRRHPLRWRRRDGDGPEPWGEALDDLATPQRRLVVLTPAGRTFTQPMAQELAAEAHLILACGRYEGIDARVAEDAATRMRVDELSIGDYVLNGGERPRPWWWSRQWSGSARVIGNPESLREESHSQQHHGLLEGPVYTKPPEGGGEPYPRCCSAAITPRSRLAAGAGPDPDPTASAGAAAGHPGGVSGGAGPGGCR